MLFTYIACSLSIVLLSISTVVGLNLNYQYSWVVYAYALDKLTLFQLNNKWYDKEKIFLLVVFAKL
mgnify:FL=1|jgi:uncharacterized membrane protein YhdT|tara:strand:+ start:96 stop:293 length:198 start_codon:yes stop_codon:yes gene_type:complete